MIEKISILKHHIDLIKECGFGLRGKKNLTKEIANYVDDLPSYQYAFKNKSDRETFSKALEEASIAVVEGRFKELADYKKPGFMKQNFDLICLKCPNCQPKEGVCKIQRENSDEKVRQKLLQVLKPNQ